MNEVRPNNEMDGVADIADKIQKEHAVLLTSAITDSEILDSTLNDVARQRLQDLFKRRNCQKVAIDDRVIALSSEIRDYYQQRKAVDNLPTLTTPDAIHLAAAIHYGATEFHTFDERNETRKRRALIPLSGNVAGHKLIICKPPIPAGVQLPLLRDAGGSLQ